MPSWRIHLEICRSVLNVEHCDEDLKGLDELIDSPGSHDVGRRDTRRDPVTFASLLVKCCLQLGSSSEYPEHRKLGLRSLGERLARKVGDIDAFLASIAKELNQLIPSKRWSSDPIAEKAMRLFGVAAHLYVSELAEGGSEEEKLVLAWYLSQPERLPVQRKALEYAILHHVVDLAAEYVARERSGDGVAHRVVGRVEGNGTLREVMEKLDLLIVGVDTGEREVYSPSELLKQVMTALRRRAEEVYTILARNRASKGVFPGSKAAIDEVRDLFQGLQRLRGLHGFITVNGKTLPLAAAATRAVSLLREGREVRVEFYGREYDAIEILYGKARPELVLTARGYAELKHKLCTELPGDGSRLLGGPPQLGRLREYCEALR